MRDSSITETGRPEAAGLEEMSAAEARALAQRLRTGAHVDDAEFDRLFPSALAQLSVDHWTPVQVALRAAHWLAPHRDTRVLDIGSGVGKVCLVGALATGASFTGIEQRDYLVRAAERAKSALGAGGAGDGEVRFVVANLLELEWHDYDAYYLYNPFGEHVMGGFDDSVERDAPLHDLYVRTVRKGLGRVKKGARVVTYFGFGTELAPAFELAATEAAGYDQLQLWIKRAAQW